MVCACDPRSWEEDPKIKVNFLSPTTAWTHMSTPLLEVNLLSA